ncbi:hypothetical protein E4U54_006697 [Claviceps lovelessii]|nr:hypothetical protein E4U54_006697 [Claviceps lovelessii]
MAGLKTALLAWLAVSAGARQTGPPTGAPAAPGRAGGAGNWTDVDLLQFALTLGVAGVTYLFLSKAAPLDGVLTDEDTVAGPIFLGL